MRQEKNQKIPSFSNLLKQSKRVLCYGNKCLHDKIYCNIVVILRFYNVKLLFIISIVFWKRM